MSDWLGFVIGVLLISAASLVITWFVGRLFMRGFLIPNP
jgi:hypothetical protein